MASFSESEQAIVMKNVRRLMLQAGIKSNSTLEEDTALNLSAGYISKLNKYNAKLSYRIVHAFANYFNVTADYLLFDFDKSSSDVAALHAFFNKLFLMAKDELLYWNETSLNDTSHFEDNCTLYGPIVEEFRISDPDQIDASYPPHLADIANKLLNGKLDTYLRSGARSIKNGIIHNDTLYTRLELQDSFFQCEIGTSGEKLFLYKVKYLNEAKDLTLPDIIEAYLQKETANYFLCSTLSVPDLSNRLNDLYQIARDDTQANRLDKGARELINQFINE